MYKYKGKHMPKRRWPKVLLILVLLAGILGGAWYLLSHYKVKTVYVDGNLHYTKEEIMEIVMAGTLGDNSLYLSYKYKNKSITDVPFVAAMDVTVLAPDTIRINVYEKALAGYVKYLGRYMYFDKEGTIVESSTVKTVGIPQITGLSFDYVVVGSPLPVENQDVFASILSVTQTLNKYTLTADRIYFGANEEMNIFFGNVKVAFGTDKWLDEKIILLQNLLPNLEGREGTLDLTNYSPSTNIYSFR